MKLSYFAETDTLYIDLRDEPAAETEDLTENVLVDYNAQRQIVGITIEHAAQQAELSSVELHGLPHDLVRIATAAQAPAVHSAP